MAPNLAVSQHDMIRDMLLDGSMTQIDMAKHQQMARDGDDVSPHLCLLAFIKKQWHEYESSPHQDFGAYLEW
ncbi:hypothetical protein CC86DRAFT_411586 [Ophiobolus disseminans]|uniref:Uncharacterized protein n=1 Tax=Ophiobolus disseminans TaxID=1469910 RepID=A0A6A6ZJ44_9PLEO|nr:hypothetical protein CC86DRAFT_411586 [Ophiobolus disseminans]